MCECVREKESVSAEKNVSLNKSENPPKSFMSRIRLGLVIIRGEVSREKIQQKHQRILAKTHVLFGAVENLVAQLAVELHDWLFVLVGVLSE